MKLALSLTLLVLAACDGGSGGGATGLCDTFCDRELRCDPESTTCDRAECDSFESRVRSEAGAAITACFADLACGSSDDQCFVEGIEASTERPIDEEFATACSAANQTCEIGDDFCSASVLFEEEHVEAGIECFDVPSCDGMELCLDETFGL